MSSVPKSLAVQAVLVALLFGCRPLLAAIDPNIPELAAIVKARDDDRGMVLDIKEKFKPSDKEYLRAKELYRVAYGRYDSWTTALAAGIVAGSKKDLRSDKRYKEVAEAAGLASSEFSEYVESVTGASKGVSSFAASIVELGIKIWFAMRDAAFKERKEIADDLTGRLKWEPWESIKAESSSSSAKTGAAP